jgi:hypothetical protein
MKASICFVLLLAGSVVLPASACKFRKRTVCVSPSMPSFVVVAVEQRQEDPRKNAIDRGIRFLRDIEDGKGNFEHTWRIARARAGGVTALAVVALLKAGVPANDPLIQRCLKYLRTKPPEQTYTVGLQTMAFCLAGEKEDRQLVQRNLKWLAETRVDGGWGYDASRVAPPDHSINFYAILALAEAHRAGFKIDREMLEKLHDEYMQNKKGEWRYRNSPRPSITMTSQGLCNLLITAGLLGPKKSMEQEDITRLALKFLSDHFPADIEKEGAAFPHPFYCLHGIRQLGERSGVKLLGKHDWDQVGSKFLLETQKANGSWSGTTGLDIWPPVATSFALLFLAR